nr:serine/threonine-protein kinase [Pseudenhygromyxa sp. WMMC2535]
MARGAARGRAFSTRRLRSTSPAPPPTSLPVPGSASLPPHSLPPHSLPPHLAAPLADPLPPPLAGPTPSAGDRSGVVIVGRYRLIEPIGRGGMGTVYLAEHTTLPRRFALKLLNDQYAKREDIAARFLLEAQAVSRIDHPNVVSVVDFGATEDGAAFLVMELLHGEALEDLAKSAPLPWPRIRHLMIQLCHGLQAAHDVGVVHRDVKPGNIIRTTYGDDPDALRILDFGLAKLQASGGLRLTRTGMILGTPGYMSPEQARGAALDHRTDLYAAGVVLYRLLCGRTPFVASSFAAMRNQHMLAPPDPPSRWAPDAGIDAEMDALALRALAKEPEHRFASMTEFAAAIDAVGEGRGPVPLLERRTHLLSVEQAASLSSGSLVLGAGASMDWARRPDGELYTSTPDAGAATPSAAPPTSRPARPRRALILSLTALALISGAAALGVAAPEGDATDEGSEPDEADELGERHGQASPDDAPAPAPSIQAMAAQPVHLELHANVPVRVLEADDFAILGDTQESAIVHLPREDRPMGIILRAEGFLDQATVIVPNRDQSLYFELEPAPSPSHVHTSGHASGASTPAQDQARGQTPGTSPTPASEPAKREPEREQALPFAPELRNPWAN